MAHHKKINDKNFGQKIAALYVGCSVALMRWSNRYDNIHMLVNLKKAFDFANHNILFKKLDSYGVHNKYYYNG